MNSSFRPRFLGIYLSALLAFSAGVVTERTGLFPGSAPKSALVLEPFFEACQLVDEHYVDRGAVKPERLTRGAIDGLLMSLGDIGHTTYLTPEEFAQVERGLKGQLYGIGARVTLRKKQFVVTHTFAGSPARKAGLLAGDVLVEVDGHDVKGLTLQRVVEMVRGEPKSTVHLRVRRKGRDDPVSLSILRGEVTIPAVTWHLLPGTPIAHLAIQDFGSGADEQLRKALKESRAQGAKALLVDVRGNPGGLKAQAVAVTSEFLAEGTVFVEQDAKGRHKPVPVQEGGHATQIPMCLLIDEGTASSAEIFAGAIQDYGRGKLVGSRTFGTGTVLQAFALSDGSVVLLAVSEWLTPKGRKIWHAGISPDVQIALPTDANFVLPETEANWTADDLKKCDDQQLLKALAVLKAQIK